MEYIKKKQVAEDVLNEYLSEPGLSILNRKQKHLVIGAMIEFHNQLTSDGVAADVSISSGSLIQNLRDRHGCILWVSPISSQETNKVIGWYYEGECLLEKGILPNTFHNSERHESANAAEKAAVEWACKELGINVSSLASSEKKAPESHDCDNPDTWHNNCREDIRNGMNEAERRNAANSFGPNWANIMSGLGDQ